MTSFPGESVEYRQARNRLLQQEIELRRITEAVAAARRVLPSGGVVPHDYVFEGSGPDGSSVPLRLSQLFEEGKDTLFTYNMMFPRAPDEDLPCPSCTQFLDSFDGVVEHACQRINVIVVVEAALPRALEHARVRGRRHLRMVSSADNTFNRDYHGENPEDGQQQPMLNVFRRQATSFATSGARNSSTNRLILAKTPDTATPSIPSGTSSISRPRDADRTGIPTSPTTDRQRRATSVVVALLGEPIPVERDTPDRASSGSASRQN